MGDTMLYLDYVATTPLNDEVRRTYEDLLKKYFANADSIHQLGVEVDRLMTKSRMKLAELLKVKENELIFTSGASEANNLALKGVCFQYQNRGKHIITTAVEHSSVYETCKQLEQDFGFRVTYLQSPIQLSELEAALCPDTILVSIMMVNNEIGTIHPIEAIHQCLKNHPNVFFHVDMVQALGKIPVDLRLCDLASFSAHKLYGLKGSGLLYKSQRVTLKPQICGGQQEFGLRAGTSNACTNIVLAKTIRLALENLDEKLARVKVIHQRMRDYFETLDHCVINSPSDGSPYILNVSLLDYKPEVLIHALEAYDIYISTKSACASKKQSMPRTLAAMEVDEAVGNSALRISFSPQLTDQDLDYFFNAMDHVLKSIKKKG